MVGTLVRERRRGRGWSQIRLATETGLTQNYVSRIERGEVDLPQRATLERLGAALRAAIPGLPPAEQNAALRLLIDHVAVDGRAATVAWHAAVRVACGLPEPGPPTP